MTEAGHVFEISGAHIGVINTSIKAFSNGAMSVGTISRDPLVYPGHGTGQQHLEDFIEAEKQRAAEGWKHPEEDPLFTYKIQMLNTRYSYYLCSDGLLRLGVGNRSLFPPPPLSNFVKNQKHRYSRDTNQLYKPDLHTAILDGADVPRLYLPPKQYMADVIGRGLRASKGRLAPEGYERPTLEEIRAKWEYRQA